MTIKHHPEPESLMSCSAGSMPEAFAAVMASHIDVCPTCREHLAVMEHIGVALFESLIPAAVASAAPVLAMRSLEAERGDPTVRRVDGDVPAPLVETLGSSLDHVPWKRVAPNVWQHQIALSHEDMGTLRLLKVAPGQVIPSHGHSGSEMTMVLRGAFEDATGHYGVGDVADLGEDAAHAPIADATEGCICLVAMDGKLRFKSRIARLVQPLMGF